MTVGEAPSPVAQGNLEATPFAHVLLYIRERQMSGTLAVWPEQAPGAPERRGQDRILFEAGQPVAARLLDPASQLGVGLLAIFPRRQAPYAFYPQDLIGGQPGAIRGTVDPLMLVAASLRGSSRDDVVERVLAGLGSDRLRFRPTLPLAGFDFKPKELAFIEVLRASPDTAPALVSKWEEPRMAKRILYLLALTRCLEQLKGAEAERVSRPPVLTATERLSRPPTETPASPLTRSSVPPIEEGRISQPPGGRDPATTTGSHRAATTTGAHRRSDPGAAPYESPSGSFTADPSTLDTPSGAHRRNAARRPDPPPPPPPGLSAEQREQWKKVSNRFQSIDRENYYDMLGLRRDATPADVDQKYLVLVKTWHPDRLPQELAPLRPFADRIFHHLTEAKETLADLEKRTRYQKSVDEGGGTPESDRKVQAVVTAAMEFRKVEIYVKRRDWKGALQALEPVLELDPQESDYLGMRGFLIYQLHGIDQKNQFLEAIRYLDEALKQNPDNERALFTKALICKQKENHAEALKLFKQVVRNNPKHIDAVREVRLATMRGQSKSVPPKGKEHESKGFFSGLFNGKKK